MIRDVNENAWYRISCVRSRSSRDDMASLTDGIEVARKLLDQEAFGEMVDKEVFPGRDNEKACTDRGWHTLAVEKLNPMFWPKCCCLSLDFPVSVFLCIPFLVCSVGSQSRHVRACRHSSSHPLVSLMSKLTVAGSQEPRGWFSCNALVHLVTPSVCLVNAIFVV